MRQVAIGASRALVIGALLAGLAACSSPAPAPQSRIQLPDFTALVKRAAPAVVNISAKPKDDDKEQTPDAQTPFHDWFRHFFHGGPDAPPPQELPQAAVGSGFIISADGYILTNKHVVADEGQIVVKLSDRRQLVAKLVGSDDRTDIALLKVNAHDLPTVQIGDVDKLQVGAWVLAIGSPFGFETSVTAGIVSAKGRSLSNEQYVPFIQTDVAINPGNSGGPLFNLAGKVVGINSQIYSRTGGYQGVSFAIPVDVAMHVVKQLRGGHQVRRGWLGVQIQEVNRKLAESFGMQRPEGALIARVLPDSPASRSGLKQGDVIRRFNGKQVSTAAALPAIVGQAQPGKRVPVVVLRDGKRKTLQVKLGELDNDSQAANQPSAAGQGDTAPVLGLDLRDLNNAERKKLGVARGGVVVSGVHGGEGARAGLRTGDVILSVGGDHVSGAAALRKRLAQADKPVALLIRRDGAPMFLALDPGS